MNFSIRIKAAFLTACMAFAMVVPGCTPKGEAFLSSVSDQASETLTTALPDTGSESGSESGTLPEDSSSETIPSSLHMDPPEVDTEAPVFISYPRTIQLQKGKEFVYDLPGGIIGKETRQIHAVGDILDGVESAEGIDAA